MKKLMYSKGGVDVENFQFRKVFRQDSKLRMRASRTSSLSSRWTSSILVLSSKRKESDIENLNSPSAAFQSYADVGHLYGENAHGWHALVAELSMLAMGREFSNYGA